MQELLQQAWGWIQHNDTFVQIVVWTSVGLLLLLVITLPVAIARMPADWFLESRERRKRGHPIVRGILRVLRNVVGWIAIVAGVAMLVLPGQGLLTILVGLLLADVPGKRKLALKIVRRPAVRSWVTWIREKAGREPLVFPQEGSA